MTQDLTNIDRAAIYLNLLELYAASEDVDKALGLWTQMQEVRTRPVMLPLAATHVSSQGRSGPRTPEYKAEKIPPTPGFKPGSPVSKTSILYLFDFH